MPTGPAFPMNYAHWRSLDAQERGRVINALGGLSVGEDVIGATLDSDMRTSLKAAAAMLEEQDECVAPTHEQGLETFPPPADFIGPNPTTAEAMSLVTFLNEQHQDMMSDSLAAVEMVATGDVVQIVLGEQVLYCSESSPDYTDDDKPIDPRVGILAALHAHAVAYHELAAKLYDFLYPPGPRPCGIA